VVFVGKGYLQMKRIAVFTLLAALSLAWSTPATAQRLDMEQSARKSQKDAKKQQKMYKKAAKNQQKAIPEVARKGATESEQAGESTRQAHGINRDSSGCNSNGCANTSMPASRNTPPRNNRDEAY
jgi:hypothetical protein